MMSHIMWHSFSLPKGAHTQNTYGLADLLLIIYMICCNLFYYVYILQASIAPFFLFLHLLSFKD